jgi:hypothetical protein
MRCCDATNEDVGKEITICLLCYRGWREEENL